MYLVLFWLKISKICNSSTAAAPGGSEARFVGRRNFCLTYTTWQLENPDKFSGRHLCQLTKALKKINLKIQSLLAPKKNRSGESLPCRSAYKMQIYSRRIRTVQTKHDLLMALYHYMAGHIHFMFWIIKQDKNQAGHHHVQGSEMLSESWKGINIPLFPNS